MEEEKTQIQGQRIKQVNKDRKQETGSNKIDAKIQLFELIKNKSKITESKNGEEEKTYVVSI